MSARRAPVGQLPIPVIALAGATAAPGPRPSAPVPAPPPAAPTSSPPRRLLFATADAERRAHDLERRMLLSGRSWLDILSLSCATNGSTLDLVLAGSTLPTARAARETALRLLVDAGVGTEAEVAAALGIADHRALDERDRTGAT